MNKAIKLFDFSITHVESLILNHSNTIQIEKIKNKTIKVIGRELLVYISYPYREYIHFNQIERVGVTVSKDLVKIDLESNEIREINNNSIDLILSVNEYDVLKLEECDMTPILSFVLMYYTKKQGTEKSLEKEKMFKKCSVVFGAFHLSLDLLEENSLFHAKFSQIKNVRYPHANKYGRLDIEIGSLSKQLKRLTANKSINVHDEELEKYKEYSYILDLIKTDQLEAIDKMKIKFEKQIFISYTEIFFTLSCLYIVPIEFFPLISHKEDLNLLNNIETINFFENLIEIAMTTYSKSKDFWDKAEWVLTETTLNKTTTFDIEKFVNEELALVLGHIFRATAILLPYCDDYSFFKDKLGEDDVYQDVYTNKGGDCEDFSCSIYRTIRLFGKIKHQSKKISLLQKLMGCYIPFIAKMIVNQYEEKNLDLENMQLHSVCVLLPKSKINFANNFIPQYKNREKKYLRLDENQLQCILLDGTQRMKMILKPSNRKIEDTMYNIKSYFVVVGSKRIIWDEDKFV